MDPLTHILLTRRLMSKRFDAAVAGGIGPDIPTHSKRHWGPRFLWPFSDVVVDGISWGDIGTQKLAILLRWKAD
jgi:hypothetical protein